MIIASSSEAIDRIGQAIFQPCISAESFRQGLHGAAGLEPAHSLDEDRAREPKESGKGAAVIETRVVLYGHRDPKVATTRDRPLASEGPS